MKKYFISFEYRNKVSGSITSTGSGIIEANNPEEAIERQKRECRQVVQDIGANADSFDTIVTRLNNVE